MIQTYIGKLSFLSGKFLENLKFDLDWLKLSLPQPAPKKYRYLIDKYIAVMSNHRVINYLGYPFKYDNRLSPALLQTYPHEILELSEHIQLKSLKTVFDVGANVGQFAWTLKSYFPNLEVHSFEPNPVIYPLLKTNSEQLPNWRVYNFGIGPDFARIPFFFVEGKSSQGSVLESNSCLNLQATEITKITANIKPLNSETLASLELPTHVDLLKIDVEGFELEALKGLSEITWKFLYIEVSDTRAGAVSLEGVRLAVEAIWNHRPDVLWAGDLSQPTRNVLLKLPD